MGPVSNLRAGSPGLPFQTEEPLNATGTNPEKSFRKIVLEIELPVG
jgi:hypothetical protein